MAEERDTLIYEQSLSVGPAEAPPRPDAGARDNCTVFPGYPGC